MVKNCQQCGIEFKRKGRAYKFCSIVCSFKWRKIHPINCYNKGKKGMVNSGSFKKGHGFWTGKKRSEKDRKLMSEAQKRNPNKYWLGKSRPEVAGENSHMWKGGVNPENMKQRRSSKYLIWRTSVFIRDNYTCQKCLKKGGYLIGHHINNFSDNINGRTAIENGITLCKKCHLEFHNEYGRKNNTQQQLYDFILNIYLMSA